MLDPLIAHTQMLHDVTNGPAALLRAVRCFAAWMMIGHFSEYL